MVANDSTGVSFPKADLTGQSFGKWVVLEFANKRRNGIALWTCRCECGVVRDVMATNLTRNLSRGCGCNKIGNRKHGLMKRPEYKVWKGMRERCRNPKHQKYARYGGRGIKVCDAWMESFEAFFRDVGPRPTDKHSLDRYPNNDGNYEPGNVRWATQKEQTRNTCDNHLLTLNGVTKTVIEWSESTGLTYRTILSRLGRGKTVEQALGHS